MAYFNGPVSLAKISHIIHEFALGHCGLYFMVQSSNNIFWICIILGLMHCAITLRDFILMVGQYLISVGLYVHSHVSESRALFVLKTFVSICSTSF